MVTAPRIRLVLCVVVLLSLGLPKAVAEQPERLRLDAVSHAHGESGGTTEYKIGQGFPYPPWDVGPLEGVSFDVLTAICEANAHMTCEVVVLPYEDCVVTDAEGNANVGPALASGEVDACMGWSITPERERLGAEFGHGYSSGSTPQLIARNGNTAFDTLGGEGSLAQAEVGFTTGFYNDEVCLSTAYSDFSAVIFPSDQAGIDAMVAALLQGDIDLVFWGSFNTVPDGARLVGEPIQTCGPAFGLLTYPPGTSRECRSDELRRDYNCGLALIRANGVLDQICSQSPHPGGDPVCLLEGPAPTVQCVADNLPQPTAAHGESGGTTEYKIGQGFPYPPWDVGPLEGVSFDVLTAICEANARMTCEVVVLPYEDCVVTDAEGNANVGPALASGEVDACMGWSITPERERLGAEFGHGYSSGSTPQLIARNGNTAFDTLGGEGSLAQAEVGFTTGFYNDEVCLSTAYSDFSAVIFPSDQAGIDAMVAALLQGDIDLVFWGSFNTVPDGARLVGEPIQTCGPAFGLLTYPPGTSRECRSDELRRDYNCGLALIRANGVLDQICSQSPHPGGDPVCLLEGPAPTVQCVANNLPQPTVTPTPTVRPPTPTVPPPTDTPAPSGSRQGCAIVAPVDGQIAWLLLLPAAVLLWLRRRQATDPPGPS